MLQLYRNSFYRNIFCFFSLVCWPFVLSEIIPQNEIDDLQVLGDYRSIKLKWNSKNATNFKIRYCELSNWQIKSRCKNQTIEYHQSEENSSINSKHDSEDGFIELKKTHPNHYEASINSLRVQTNYSVSIQANISSKNFNENTVIVTTKSFTAKTLKCLANSSEIQVFTGPYFNGRISVEGSDNPSCYINGDGNNPQESYNFTINHDLCNSKTIDNIRIETMVIVNENREILTHNSRRYLVVCGFDPDKYTLTASVSVPNFLLKKLFDRLKEKPSSNNVNKQDYKRNGLVNKDKYSVIIERNSILKKKHLIK